MIATNRKLNPLDITDAIAKTIFRFIFLNNLAFNKHTRRIYMSSAFMKALVIFGVYRWQDLAWLHNWAIHKRMFWEIDYRDNWRFV